MPEWKEEIREKLAGLHLPPAREAEIIDELSENLANLYEEILAEGATPEEAYREVLSNLNQSDLVAELRAMSVPSTRMCAPFLIVVATCSASRGRKIAMRCHSTFETHSSSAFFQERCVATERTVNFEPLFRA
jgi:hypothetical protein